MYIFLEVNHATYSNRQHNDPNSLNIEKMYIEVEKTNSRAGVAVSKSVKRGAGIAEKEGYGLI